MERSKDEKRKYIKSYCRSKQETIRKFQEVLSQGNEAFVCYDRSKQLDGDKINMARCPEAWEDKYP